MCIYSRFKIHINLPMCCLVSRELVPAIKIQITGVFSHKNFVHPAGGVLINHLTHFPIQPRGAYSLPLAFPVSNFHRSGLSRSARINSSHKSKGSRIKKTPRCVLCTKIQATQITERRFFIPNFGCRAYIALIVMCVCSERTGES